jgi:calnexin
MALNMRRVLTILLLALAIMALVASVSASNDVEMDDDPDLGDEDDFSAEDLTNMGGQAGEELGGDIPIVNDDDDDINQEVENEEPKENEPAVIDPAGEQAEFIAPAATGAALFDDFQSGLGKWTHSAVPIYSGRFAVGQGANPTFSGDRGLIIPEKARHYAISAPVSGLENLVGSDFALSYEVKLNEGMTCGGAYLKLPTTGFPGGEAFDSNVKYSVMFGPDKCGGTDKVHFIFQSANPVTGELTEHHLTNPPSVANTYDKKTHSYGLSVTADGAVKVTVDGDVKREGSLTKDFDPPLQPEEMIDDETDKRPSDWVTKKQIPDETATRPPDFDEREEIEDMDAEKPVDWQDTEPLQVRSSTAVKPADWQDDIDGEWTPPMVPNPICEKVGCGVWKRPTINNPAYTGRWSPPLIDNPLYIGEWKPKQIPNPAYYPVDKPALLPIVAVGLELWTMDQGVVFDNIFIGTNIPAADAFSVATFTAKKDKENAAEEEKAKKSGDASNAKTTSTLARLESAISTLEAGLEPIEAWLAKIGAEPVLDMLIDAGVRKPLLAVVSIPIVVVLLMLMMLPGKKKKDKYEVAEVKKTDAVTKDDKEESTLSTGSAKASVVDEIEPKVRSRRRATAE